MSDLCYEDMTEEQRKQVAEYRRREKELTEIIEHNRAALDIELKKTRSEIVDVARMFDKKLVGLTETRRNTQNLIAMHELYVIQLEKALITKESYSFVASEAKLQLVDLNKKRCRLSSLVNKIQAEMNVVQNDCNIIIEEDKAIERGFRRNIQQYSKEPLDQDMVKMLLQVFKRRRLDENIPSGASTVKVRNSKNSSRLSKERVARRSSYSRYNVREGSSWMELKQRSIVSFRKSSGGSSFDKRTSAALSAVVTEAQLLANASEGRALVNDPFAEDGQLYTNEVAPMSQVVQLHHIPEGFRVSKDIWDGLQLLRNAKIEQEARIEETTEKVLHIKRHYDAAKQQLDSCSEQISQLNMKLKEILEKAKTEFSQADVLVQLKQGQEEIKNEVVPENPEDAVLMPLKLIEDANMMIRSLSEQKIKFLKKTKAFRRKIHFMHWNQEYLEFLSTDAKESYIDFQFLRIDSTLKKVLAGDEEESDEAKTARAEAQQEKRRKNHNETVAKLEREILELQKCTDARNAENDRLKEHLQHLQANVRTQQGETLEEVKVG